MADRDRVSLPDTHSGSRTSALALSILAGCVRRGGPRPSEYPQVSAALSVLSIDRVPPEQVAEVLAPTLTPDTLHGWAYLRPHGVVADHVLIDRVLAREVSADPLATAWDEFFQAQPVAQAVRNRAAYFHSLLSRLETRRPQGGAVLVAGCGSAREVADYLTGHPDSRLRLTATDAAPPAVARAEARCRGLRQPVTVLLEDPGGLGPRGRFDLVWAPAHGGCFDNHQWVAQAKRLHGLVAPGGEVVLGDLSTAGPSRPYLEVMLRWRLAYRSAEDVAALAHDAAGPDAVVRIEREPLGAYLFTRIGARG
jgi:extracellular factor (EF) 3-hydroxypalmitic acid methyl ester biosynthesis protein